MSKSKKDVEPVTISKTEKVEAKFTKGAIISSSKFEGRRDLLQVLLNDGELYAISEVETKIKNYLTMEV